LETETLPGVVEGFSEEVEIDRLREDGDGAGFGLRTEWIEGKLEG
jgi:hypothetical protein